MTLWDWSSMYWKPSWDTQRAGYGIWEDIGWTDDILFKKWTGFRCLNSRNLNKLRCTYLKICICLGPQSLSVNLKTRVNTLGLAFALIWWPLLWTNWRLYVLYYGPRNTGSEYLSGPHLSNGITFLIWWFAMFTANNGFLSRNCGERCFFGLV